MKDGSRGWMTVKELRNLLIEVPGDYMVLPYEEKQLYITDSTRKKNLGVVDFIDEKVKMKETVS